MASVRKRLVGEVSFIFKGMVAFGEKKGADKARALKEGKPFFYYYRGKIYSFSTYDNYYKEAKEFVFWCSERYGIKSTYRIAPEMMVEYVKEQVGKISNNTIKTRIAAIAKLAEGIELKTGKDKATAFHLASKQLQASLPKQVPSRPVYSSQQISNLEQKLNKTSPHYGLVFKVHVETGCRLRELSKLTKKDLLGLVDNQTQGILSIKGKGGRLRELSVSSETYMKVADYLEKKEVLCSYNGYRQALRRASESLSVGVAATHAVRRFAAQRLMREKLDEYSKQGIANRQAREMAIGDVNVMLGHSKDRMSTTHIYLNVKG
jgi:site-specific recombinase XerD